MTQRTIHGLEAVVLEGRRSAEVRSHGEALVQEVVDLRAEARAKARRAAGIRHGVDCDCNQCLEETDGVHRPYEIVAVPDPIHGLTYDGQHPMPQEVVDVLAKRGPVVVEWNLPHEGKGQPDCGTFLEWVGAVTEKGTLDAWPRIRRCGQRDCQECGPEFDAEGNVVRAGTWEVRGARRAADKAAGHLEDLRRRGGMHQTPRVGHFVLSVPPSMWEDLEPQNRTLARLHQLLRMSCKLMRRVGLMGAFRVTHSHRLPGRFNKRMHLAPGLHFHFIGITKCLLTARLWGSEVAKIHAETGVVIKKVKDACHNLHQGPCAQICRCEGSEGPDPNRSLFGTLLYLLSHATWPTLGILRTPGESCREKARTYPFLSPYPAFVKTSTQAKAITPVGQWVLQPVARVETPLDEDTSPGTGRAYRATDLFTVAFDRPPPSTLPFLVVPAGCFSIDRSTRTVQVRLRDFLPRVNP